MQERKGQEVFRKKWGWGIGGLINCSEDLFFQTQAIYYYLI